MVFTLVELIICTATEYLPKSYMVIISIIRKSISGLRGSADDQSHRYCTANCSAKVAAGGALY